MTNELPYTNQSFTKRFYSESFKNKLYNGNYDSDLANFLRNQVSQTYIDDQRTAMSDFIIYNDLVKASNYCFKNQSGTIIPFYDTINC